MIKLKFNRKFVPLVAPFVAKRDIRYYLCGIHVEAAKDRDGVYVVGCDGHRLTVGYDREGVLEGDDGKGVTMRMPSAFVSACRARSPVPLMVVAQDNRVSVGVDFDHAHGDLETYVMPGKPWVQGNYPDWRRVLPHWEDLKPGCAASVAPEYLADYLKLSDRKSVYNGIMFWQANPDGAVVVQHTGQPELISILMPRRFDQGDIDRLRRLIPEVVATTKKEVA